MIKPIIKTRLFRITQAAEDSLGYTLVGLRAEWGGVQFDSEFDPKTGDFYVTMLASEVDTNYFYNKIITKFKKIP